MHKETVECVVIGAGVIGLAIARAFAQKGRHVFVLEAAEKTGSGISSRNSEVIHAGIYYAKNTLKAQLCVAGKKQLYQYAENRNIPHKKCGKLIVATEENQIKMLHDIKARGEENGVDDLKVLSQNNVARIEPNLECVAALFSPSTGIIDTHNYMLSLEGDIENHGGDIICNTHVSSITATDKKIELFIKSNGEDICLNAKTLINAAGLGAVNLAHKITGFPKDKIPFPRYAKGNYFSLTGKNPFSHLIYPIPEQSGLGVHLTLDLANKARFGPDVEWVDQIDFNVSPKRAETFYPLIRKYWPDLPDDTLVPDYAGIRPKISLHKNGEIYTDFMIQGSQDHNIPGLVNLFGIESPGLTASLAIAHYVQNLV